MLKYGFRIGMMLVSLAGAVLLQGQSTPIAVPKRQPPRLPVCSFCPVGAQCSYPDCPPNMFEKFPAAAFLGPGMQIWPDGNHRSGQSNYAGTRLVSRNQNFYAQVEESTCQFRVYQVTRTGKGAATVSTSIKVWETTQPDLTHIGGTCIFKLNGNDGSFEASDFIPVNTYTRIQIWGLCQVGCVTGPYFAMLNDSNGSLEVHVGTAPTDDHGIWKMYGGPAAAANNFGYPGRSSPPSVMDQAVTYGILIITGGTVWVP